MGASVENGDQGGALRSQRVMGVVAGARVWSAPATAPVVGPEGMRGSAGPVADLVENLAPGDELVVRYHSRGCFHNYGAELRFASVNGVTRLEGRAGNRWGTEAVVDPRELTRAEIRGIDEELVTLRTKAREGFCTTETSYELNWKRGGEVTRTETIFDHSCAPWARYAFGSDSTGEPKPVITLEAVGATALYRNVARQ